MSKVDERTRAGSTDPERRVGRPARLAIEQIVDAAAGYVAEHGLEELTMRAIAQRLSSSPMALYRHVADRDELVARTVDRALADVELPPHPSPSDTKDWLIAMVAIVRHRLLQLPGVAEHLLLNGPTGPHSMAFMDRVCHVLADTGRSPREVAHAYDWLMTTVAAYVSKQDRLDRAGGGRTAANRFSERTAAYVDRLPHLAEVVGEFTGDSHSAFERATGAVIDVLTADAQPLEIGDGWS